MNEREKRAFAVEGLEIRAEEGKPDKLVGRIVPFNTWSQEIYGFVERFEPGAFGDLNGTDILANIEHDYTQTIARTPETLQIEELDDGVWMTMTPIDTRAGNDAVELVRSGVVDGASIEFRVLKNMDEWDVTELPNKRTILKDGAKLEGFALTARPVYPDTSAALRSLETWQEEHSPEVTGSTDKARRRLRIAESS